MHVYSDTGNLFVVNHIPPSVNRLLDVGCGCGDTGRLIKQRNSEVWIEGVTYNADEASAASKVLDKVHVFNLESPLPESLGEAFDCILFSHVLEHLRDPTNILNSFLNYLTSDGKLVIALPNVLEWRTRLRFLRGKWQYENCGMLDRTHLKFFTFNSAVDELIRDDLISRLIVTAKLGDGSVPLGPLRRIGATKSFNRKLDRLGVKHWPNLFAQQFLIIARKRGVAR